LKVVFLRPSTHTQREPLQKRKEKKEKKNYASSKKLLASIEEKGPLGKKSPFTRKEKGFQ